MLSLSILLLALSQQRVGGQFEEFHSFTGNGGEYGREMAGLGDLDGDGFSEVLIAAPPVGGLDIGRVYVYSGHTGAELAHLTGGGTYRGFGAQVGGLGDVNGDGTPDFIITANRTSSNGLTKNGAVLVYSGADFSLLYHKDGSVDDQQLGFRLALMDDLDGDGVTDFAVTTAEPNGVNQSRGVYIYSGASGTQLNFIENVITGMGFGKAIANAGDIDGDGWNDVVVGAPDRNLGNIQGAGTVYAYSSATGQQLLEVKGTSNSKGLGTSLEGVGDQDGDGVPDFLCGAPLGHPSSNGSPFGGAFVYSGSDGSLIWSRYGWIYGGEYGREICVLGDLNEDGAFEYCVSQGGSRLNTNVFIYYGGDGEQISQVDGRVDYMAAVGDLKNDGGPDLILGNTKYSNNTFRVYGFNAFVRTPVSELSASTGGMIPIEIDFPTTAGAPYKVLVSGASGWTNDGIHVPLVQDQLYLNSAAGIYPGDHHHNLHGTLGPGGSASAYFNFPTTLANSLIGQTFWFAVVTGPAGGSYAYSSAANAILITP